MPCLRFLLPFSIAPRIVGHSNPPEIHQGPELGSPQSLQNEPRIGFIHQLLQRTCSTKGIREMIFNLLHSLILNLSQVQVVQAHQKPLTWFLCMSWKPLYPFMYNLKLCTDTASSNRPWSTSARAIFCRHKSLSNSRVASLFDNRKGFATQNVCHTEFPTWIEGALDSRFQNPSNWSFTLGHENRSTQKKILYFDLSQFRILI